MMTQTMTATTRYLTPAREGALAVDWTGLSVLPRHQPATKPSVCLPVDALLVTYSPRVNGVDQAHVRLLAEASTVLPPILVQHGTLRVIDGMHRVQAAKLRGDLSIEAHYFFGSDEDAFVLAVEANVAHGLPLSLADRRSAAERILRSHPEKSDRVIGELTGLAHKTVADLRARLTGDRPQSDERRVGRDGRVRPVSGVAGRRRAATVIAQNPQASLRQIASAAEVSVETARDVRIRLGRGQDPVRATEPARSTTDQAATRTMTSARAGQRPSGRDATAAEILQKLSADPSLRTDACRNLLRWLHRYATCQDVPIEAVDTVPAHCVPALAVLAKGCASAWTDLARRLEQQARSS
jgi:ParB-like chromosome segregation protein Spo0J